MNHQHLHQPVVKSEEAANIFPGTVPQHPRILLWRDEEKLLHDTIKDNRILAKLHRIIIDSCDDLIGQPILERVKIGRRLLHVSREAIRRIFFLAYAWRMTGQEKYLTRAEHEMLGIAGFSDWNPSHFLDVAEMTMALAIGYDWLYDGMSLSSRARIRQAILEKGLEPSFNSQYNTFLTRNNNWNQVCNAGMVFGALAIHEDYPETGAEVIERAFESLALAYEMYEPDGAYPEGYSYWGYGTTFHVMLISAMERILPEKWRLHDDEPFLKTGGFPLNMTTPSGNCFAWSDCGPKAGFSPAMFWFAERNQEPRLLWIEKQRLEHADFAQSAKNRLLPCALIWGKNLDFNRVSEPASCAYFAQGPSPVAAMRGSWNNPDAVFLGFKLGSPSANHGHMDIGSFFLESHGVKWALDPGKQDYESLESKGMNIFGLDQDAQRWTIQRFNNSLHNTLRVNGQLQPVQEYARLDRFSDNPEFSFATSDISCMYKGMLSQAVRGVGLIGGQYAVVRDELRGGDEPAVVRWQMLTEAEVAAADGNTLILRRSNRQLRLRVDAPARVKLATWSSQPATDYDAPNPGTILVGFEIALAAGASAVLDVKLIPESCDQPVVFNIELDQWGVKTKDIARSRSCACDR